MSAIANTNIASITWAIDNFKALPISNYTPSSPRFYCIPFTITSPIFYPPSNQNASFKLDLYHNFYINIGGVTNRHVQMTIYLVKQDVLFKPKVEYRICLVNAKGEKRHATVKQINYNLKKNISTTDKQIFYRNFVIKPKNGLLTENGALTVHCEVEILDDKKSHDIECCDDLARDYGSLLESSKLSDVVLVAGGHELKAHKAILSTRSKVFSAMFEHDCAEQRNSRVDITDVDSEVLMQLLRFIYTGKVASLDVYAADLLVAADKYQVDQLKLICSQQLATQLTPESVARTLVLADMHHETQLKQKCIEFITKQKDTIKLADWKKICESNLELAHTLFQHSMPK